MNTTIEIFCYQSIFEETKKESDEYLLRILKDYADFANYL